MKKIFLWIIVVMLSSGASVLAHEGKKNSKGCHLNKATHDYHCHATGPSGTGLSSGSEAEGTRIVSQAIDGSTIMLSNGERVSLIGVDAPKTRNSEGETEYYSAEALEYIDKQVKGKTVKLQYDDVNEGTQHKNRLGHTLAYVYLSGRNFLLNETLIKRGYARADTKGDYRYKKPFYKAQEKAQARSKGMWRPPDSMEKDMKEKEKKEKEAEEKEEN